MTQRRLAAILSADVAGYSRLMAGDEEATVRALRAYREQVELYLRQHGGRLVDFTGDNFLAEFGTAEAAVRCAREIQDELAARNAALSAERRLEFRMGVHLGDVGAEGERIFGDGVNVAARLEALAPPGGICLSAAVREQVARRLDLTLVDRGPQTLKNLPEPVHAFTLAPPGSEGVRASRSRHGLRRGVLVAIGVLALLGTALVASWPRPLGWVVALAGLSGPPEAPALPDKPSIAVLPFANMSDDPAQEYFSDGITEDVITDLSRSPRLFVIARNSSFTYKGRAVKVEDVGRELGVRYVLEGSVRRDADRIRVTAQLIDATTGFHVWSERYDRELTDLFALQSELSEQIMGAVGTEMRVAEIERLRRKPTKSLTAYDAFLRGMHHYTRFTRADMEQARGFFERAIELDPGFAFAHAQLAGIHANQYLNLWSTDRVHLDLAYDAAERALAIDPDQPAALGFKAFVLMFRGRPQEARPLIEHAIRSDPNFHFPLGLLAWSQSMSGQPLAALRTSQRVLRLNPRLPAADTSALAGLNWRAGRTDVAVNMWERVRSTNPDMLPPRVMLANFYEGQGRHDLARTLGKEILRVNPDLTAELAIRSGPFALILEDPEQREIADRLRSAGLP